MTSCFSITLKPMRHVIFLVLFAASFASAEDVSTAFNDANKFYEQGKFSEAATRYEKIVQAGSVSAPLYFNLGNAYLKSGRVGRAIVAYRSAEKLAPRDPDVRANLQFARRQAGEGSPAPRKFWESSIQKLSLNEWTVLASGVVSLWFFLLAIRQWQGDWKNSFRPAIAALGFLAVVSIVCLFSAIRQEFTQPSVIIAPEAVVRRGPYDESPSVFTLRDGTEVTVLDRKNDWLEIVDGSQRTGWLAEKQMMSLNVPRR